MGFVSDVVAFERSKLKDMAGAIKRDPERLLLGAVEPASSRMWSEATGKEYEPIVDQMGGATTKDYRRAEARGIDTTAGKTMHGLARGIAAMITGGYAAGAMGGGAAGGGSAAAGGETVAANTAATNPALIDSALGTEGYGASSAGAGGGTSWAARMGQYGGAMQNFGNAIQQMQQRPQQPLEQDAVRMAEADDWERGYDQSVTSTKQAKRPERSARMHAAVIEAGASGADPISQNGVHTAAIRELTRQIDIASAKLAELQKQRGTT